MFEPDNSETNLEQQVVQDTSESELPNELVVSILEDENDGDFSAGDLSLREAIALANEQEGADTITFDDSLNSGMISIDESLDRQLNIGDSVTIDGLGQDNLTLDGGFVFNVETDIDLNIDGLNFVGGKIDSSGNLTLTNSAISQTIGLEGNSADNSAIISRGTAYIADSTIKDNNTGIAAGNTGIFIESGTATIERSTIADNQAQSISGIIIGSEATVDLVNSTVARSRSRSIGGIQNDGTLNVFNSTVSDNGGGEVGGINNNGIVTATSSIIAGNNNEDNLVDIVGSGELVSNGNNLVGNGDNAEGFIDSDLVGTADNLIDPNLGELQNNGGSTATFALLDNSPAIDTGNNNNNLETDQRGEGFNRTVGNGTDIGAFEIQEGDDGETPTYLVVSILEDENDGDFSTGDFSLREAIAQAESGNTITFDSSLSGGIINLVLGELAIDKSLTINGLGAKNILIDADGNSRVFNVDDENSDTQLEVGLNDLTITGGSFPGSTNTQAGGGIFSNENLEINNAVIRDNFFVASGAGIYSGGTLTVNNSAIYNNSADGAGGGNSGGGIFNAGTAIITNSTISNNELANRGSSGGGIENEGTLTVTNSTVSGNRSGISNDGGEATLTSTIVAGNFGNNDIQNDDVISGGNNLIGGKSKSFEIGRAGGLANVEDSDIVGTADNPINPQLGELQDNGGATPTQALLEESPAIDAGSNPNNLETDQRGEGFNRTVGEATDIGAFEVQTADNGSNEDNDNTISTANDSGISPQGQQNIVLNDAIASNADVDLFKLNLEAGDVATFNIEAREFGSSLDSVLRVFNSEGSELASDDDGNAPFEASNFDSYIEYQAEADGEYYIGVSSFANFNYDPVNGSDTEGSSSGDYDLAISVFNGINGTSGSDRLRGTKESDFIQGFDGNDTLNGAKQKDNLVGGSGNDVLTGRNGDDLLRGEAGFDVLRGGNGNDTLGGGDGQNRLSGGLGNDIFAIGSGEDTINDFRDGSDKLLLTGDLEFTSFEELTISAVGTGTTISASDNTYATLTGISPDLITTDDIVAPDFLAANFLVEDLAAIEAK